MKFALLLDGRLHPVYLIFFSLALLDHGYLRTLNFYGYRVECRKGWLVLTSLSLSLPWLLCAPSYRF